MGQEIQHGHFRKQDFDEYNRRLLRETELLQTYFDEQCFSNTDGELKAGFEMEVWLVNDHDQPLAENEDFLKNANHPFLCPELARFNVEINGTPRVLHGKALGLMQAEFEETWKHSYKTANNMNASLLLAGILPTLQEHELTLDNMSAMTRYKALNEQVRRLRQGAPIKLDIAGQRQHLQTWHKDVMLESAATSLQVHLKVPQQLAAHAYNASMLASAPIIALSASSPYLFNYDLWAETRIPVFEQAVSVATVEGFHNERVTFGSGYAHESLMECFIENRECQPVLLPEMLDDDPESFSHLKLHNGTIWRWNRPLIGVNEDGSPHLRIEHRVIPAGPSIIDSFANAAAYYGLIGKWLAEPTPAPTKLAFSDARTNFYAAARDGLDAELVWFDGRKVSVKTLWLESLLPQMLEGLERLEIDRDDIKVYSEVIEGRLRTGCNGTTWQREFVAKHDADMHELTATYHENQRQGQPVHEWKI